MKKVAIVLVVGAALLGAFVWAILWLSTQTS